MLICAGKPEEAVGYYQAALAIRPGVPMVHNNLGVALIRANRPDEAIGQFRRASPSTPRAAPAVRTSPPPYGTWAVSDEALRELPEALRLNPRSAILHTLAGKILESDGKHGEALALYPTGRRDRSEIHARRKKHCSNS